MKLIEIKQNKKEESFYVVHLNKDEAKIMYYFAMNALVNIPKLTELMQFRGRLKSMFRTLSEILRS